MLEISRRTQFVLGGIVGLNLLIGTAAAAGVVPRPTATESVASVRSQEATLDATPDTTVAAVPEETTTVPPETTVPTTTPPTTAAPKAKAPAATVAPPTTEAPVATTPPTTAAPAPVSTAVARRNPSSAEIGGAVAQLRGYLPLTPTDAQARQLGTMVCDAFDAGSTYAQVKATALAQVSAIPFVTITPAAADAILKTAVLLFCPGHSSKLP